MYISLSRGDGCDDATADEGVKTDVEDQIALHCARLHHRHRGGLRARVWDSGRVCMWVRRVGMGNARVSVKWVQYPE